jgi:hypothetical protein
MRFEVIWLGHPPPLSLFDQGENLYAMIVISLTSFSQRDASCGPVEQSGSKVCLQIGNGA